MEEGVGLERTFAVVFCHYKLHSNLTEYGYQANKQASRPQASTALLNSSPNRKINRHRRHGTHSATYSSSAPSLLPPHSSSLFASFFFLSSLFSSSSSSSPLPPNHYHPISAVTTLLSNFLPILNRPRSLVLLGHTPDPLSSPLLLSAKGRPTIT